MVIFIVISCPEMNIFCGLYPPHRCMSCFNTEISLLTIILTVLEITVVFHMSEYQKLEEMLSSLIIRFTFKRSALSQ